MIITPDALELRKRAVAPGGPLAPLFDSLAAELEPWLGRKVYVPEAKALLSRVGGRCETDGSVLEFDPASGMLYYSDASALYSVNAATGAAALIGPHGVSGIAGLAVPEPAGLAMLLPLLLMARRKRIC